MREAICMIAYSKYSIISYVSKWICFYDLSSGKNICDHGFLKLIIFMVCIDLFMNKMTSFIPFIN